VTESPHLPGRPNLDAESFQRLLAAAYVLQEHNDRIRKATLADVEAAKSSSDRVKPAGPAESAVPNRDNGHTPAECVDNSGSTPSVALVSSDLLAEKTEAQSEQASVPAAGPDVKAAEAASVAILLCRRCGVPITAHQKFCGLCGEPQNTTQERAQPPSSAPMQLTLSLAAPQRKVPAPAPAPNVPTAAAETVGAAVSDPLPSLGGYPALNTPKEPGSPDRSKRGKIIAVIMAVLLALIGVLLWMSMFTARAASLSSVNMPLKDRVLVRLGLEKPPSIGGNPYTEVWADLQTRTYYCPGAALNGKTDHGKFMTQRNAQSEQFQPANHKACQ
jgi:hypothetical protein